MAKFVQTIYTCDICGKELPSEKGLYRIGLPCSDSDCEGRSYQKTMRLFDLCEDCRRAYYDVVIEHFAKITVNMAGYVEVKRPVKHDNGE